MNSESFFTESTKAALKNNPPGEWMPTLPDGCIRLSSGFPAPNLIPVEQLQAAVTLLLEEEKDLPLHYVGSPKMAKLKEQINDRLLRRGIRVSEEELLITSGACQAIDLVARIIMDHETVVAIESPTYMEALEVFQNYTKHFISIPVDENGLQTNKLEAMLAERKREGLPLPRILYTIPTFQNPTGTTMTMDRRKHVLELAAKYDFLILEDDAYGELYFDEQPDPLKAMDNEGRVMHLGSLSKVVAPGMRIGWITATPELITAVAWFKKDLDHPFAQATMASFLEKNDFEKRLKTLRETYQRKCTVLLSALEQYMPKPVSWYVSEGGYFVWVKIAGADTSELLTHALDEGVSYIPGKHFFLNQQDGAEYLRLSFSYAEEKEIVEGIQKLSKVIKRILL
ncbi:PLP-dependent aminotransferase family protein [Virgibacillus salinus]|uniref:2-aminoadipate transaminase n=1 Tax=Virgibacillus salinus TaxID=553311 RepID=A0A1H0XWG2_9BACI|nr:PLP-dependent aminotransferase family protein [Virgibacillus salinus]SDQ07257.1 2-aminoadipate transaminase [Virgibacillus salinus]